MNLLKSNDRIELDSGEDIQIVALLMSDVAIRDHLSKEKLAARDCQLKAPDTSKQIFAMVQL